MAKRRKSGSALSRVGVRKVIRIMEINRTAISPDVVLISGNRPTLPECDNEGVVSN